MSRSAGLNKQNTEYNAADSVEVLSYAEQVQECFLELYTQYDVANAPEKRKNEIIDSFWSDIYKQVFKPDRPQNNNCKSRLLVYDVENVQEVVEMYINLCKRFGGVIKFNQFANLTGIHRDTLYRWHKYNTSGKYIFMLNDTQYQEDSKVTLFINFNSNVYQCSSNDIYKGVETVKPIHIHNDLVVDSDAEQLERSYNNACALDNIKSMNAHERDRLSYQRYDVIKKLQEEMQDSNTNQLSNDTMGAAIRANNEEELGKLYEPKRMIQHEQIKQALSLNDLKLLDNSTNNTNNLLLDINGTDVRGGNGAE